MKKYKWFIIIGPVLLALFVWYEYQKSVNVYIISGAAMSPNYNNLDVVVVTKDLSDLKRSDVVIISSPTVLNGHALLKRIVGLPGDTVQIQGNDLSVGGKLFSGYAKGMSNPSGFTLGGDQYSLLNDNIGITADSRYFGPFYQKDIVSKVLYKASLFTKLLLILK